MKTDLIKNIEKLSKERFQVVNGFDTNPFTAIVLLLEAKGLLTQEEVNDIQEWSNNKLKEMDTKARIF